MYDTKRSEVDRETKGNCRGYDIALDFKNVVCLSPRSKKRGGEKAKEGTRKKEKDTLSGEITANETADEFLRNS